MPNCNTFPEPEPYDDKVLTDTLPEYSSIPYSAIPYSATELMPDNVCVCEK